MSRGALIVSVAGLVLFGAVARLVPHLPNATPIAAIAIVSSIYIGKRWALVLPLATLFLSDLALGLYDWRLMASVYGSFALIGCMSWVCRKRQSVLPVGASAVAASLMFFLTTNAAVWLFSPWYEKSIAGLLYAYELGIPFMRNMFVGDVAYTALLIAAFECAYALSALAKRFVTQPMS